MSVSNAAYTVSLGHDSLLFNYYPFSDPYSTPDLEAGWAPWNDVTGGYNPEVGTDTVDLSQGRWSQRTKQDGAIVELYFKGSSLNLLGTIYQAGFDVWLDGKTVETSPGNGRLASFTDLKGTDHRMLLTAHPTSNGSLWFYGAEIGVDLPDSPIINQMTADVDYGGYWIQMNDRQLGTFHAATRAGAHVSLTLHQASAVTVYGIRSLQNGHYNVTLDGNSTTYMAKSSFPSVSVLFAALDLDPSVDHQLTLTNLDEGDRLGIVSVNVTTSTPRPASNEIKPAIPLGTKIALIVAGAVALLVIVFFIVFFFLRRVRVGRRSRGKAHSTFNPFQFSTYNPSFVMVDTVTTKLPQTPLVVIGDPNVSIRSRPSGEQFKGEIERENKYDDGETTMTTTMTMNRINLFIIHYWLARHLWRSPTLVRSFTFPFPVKRPPVGITLAPPGALTWCPIEATIIRRNSRISFTSKTHRTQQMHSPSDRKVLFGVRTDLWSDRGVAYGSLRLQFLTCLLYGH
ncbi:hypothetical protein FRC19_008910 [Serendipita sp. 401]|nr:hypothetical protein FRC19_008910 [Serendipita sp. 401]